MDPEFVGWLLECPGVTKTSVGRKLGVTRQAVHQAIVRAQRTATVSEPIDLSTNSMDEITRLAVEAHLRKSRGNVCAAAESLGVSPSTVRSAMRRFGIERAAVRGVS